MKRKVIKQGTGTLMISLPKAWVKRYGIKKGQELELTEDQGIVRVYPPAMMPEKSLAITITLPTESAIRVLLTNAYRMGYDKIILTYPSKETYQIIKQIVQTRLLGFEITEQKALTCVIEELTHPQEKHHEMIFLKIFYNIQEMIRMIEEALLRPKSLAISDLEEYETRIYRYDHFFRRTLSKKNDSRILLLWNFQTLLIHAQREIYFLGITIGKEQKKASKNIREIYAFLSPYFSLLLQAYQHHDLTALEKIHAYQKGVIGEKEKTLLKTTKDFENLYCYHIFSALRQAYLASSPLFSLLLWESTLRK